MRSSTWRLEDLRNVILNLGFVGENLHTRQIFDCKKMFDQYPNASVSMTVTPPEGEPYPGTIERDGDLVIWDVRDSDLVAGGDGEIQLVFTQEPHIARSYNAQTHICRSQVPTGSIPSGLDDYITRADQLLDQVEDTFPAGGTTGQVLAKKSDTDYDTEWVDQGGGTEDYEELENLPQIGGVTLTGNKTLHDLGAATEAAVSEKYTKPSGGIPASDLASGVIPDPTSIIDDTAGDGDTDKVWSADKSADTASSLLTEINSRYTKPNTGIPATDMAQSVQTSLGKADSAYQKPQTGIPASDMEEGVIPDITGKADKSVTDSLQKDKAPVIIDSATGNPIVLTDGADGLPIEGMKIHLLPTQSGTGDPSPSNVRPIIGRTGLTAWRTGGKNICPRNTMRTSHVGIDYTVTDEGIRVHGEATGASYSWTSGMTYASTWLKLPAGTYTFSVTDMFGTNNSDGYVVFMGWDVDGVELNNFVLHNGSRTITRTFTKNVGLYYGIYVKNGLTVDTVIKIQAEPGSTASTYTPYVGQSYPVTFPDGQTVYGGTLDAVNGVLTVDMVMVDMGDIAWVKSTATSSVGGSVFTKSTELLNPPMAQRERYTENTMMSDQFKTGNSNLWFIADMADYEMFSNATNIYISASDYDNANDFKAAMSGVQLVYELDTPIEIQLDPITVQTLIGDNTIWSDANGTIELDYRADTKLWISGHSTTVDSALSDTSENPVQNKVIKTALDGKEPLHNTTTVSGATPTITGVENTRYICGECSTLTITAPASGCIDVVFESGATPTVLTVTSAKTGVTAIKWAGSFDPTSLEANTTYEINILDGEFGVVGSWT